MYKRGFKQELDYEREMSKFAAQSALVTHAYKMWDKNGDGLTREELARELARDPRRVVVLEGVEYQKATLVGELDEMDFDTTQEGEVDDEGHVLMFDDQTFKKGVQYQVQITDSSELKEVDGSKLKWAAGLPLSMARLFSAQIFSKADADATNSDSMFDANVVVPENSLRNMPLQKGKSRLVAEPRLECNELVDILSHDICTFASLTNYMKKKKQRLGDERSNPLSVVGRNATQT